MAQHNVGTRVRTTIPLLGIAAVAWAVTFERMRGMDAGPGTDLGGLGWYLGVWGTMTAAMMLPSATPAVLLFARFSSRAGTVLFVAAYLAVWTAFGLVAFGLFQAATSFDTGWLAWDSAGPYAAGGTIVAAGIYELTPLKQRFLRRCRDRVEVAESSLRAGLSNGVDCVGCCLGLMAALFALGVMSVVWMAIVAGAILVEKVLPHGPRLTRAVALGLVALGLWVAFSPATVPGLTEPDRSPALHMNMEGGTDDEPPSGNPRRMAGSSNDVAGAGEGAHAPQR